MNIDDLPTDHPAIVFSRLHKKFCQECLCFELPINKLYTDAIDAKWTDPYTGKPEQLSSVFYKYISLTPEVSEWFSDSPKLTSSESHTLAMVNECRTKLIYAQNNLNNSLNSCTHDLISRALCVLEAWQEAILSRLRKTQDI